MRRLLLLALFLQFAGTGMAQNYQCLQGGVKRYFVNGNGYLRGMRVDSVRMSGGDVVYYPFHTARGNYLTSSVTPLDSNGGSWLGKKVIQRNDGTFLFDNMWGDTIVIKTQALLGESWIFYNDTTTLYYKAELIAIDSMTVLGSPDSVKRILITARNPAGIVASDPVDSFQVTLSKSHGFVDVFDLYTFPYHKPDSIYTHGTDFYLDYLVDAVFYTFSHYPIAANSKFTLTDLINPTFMQLYDWNIGDVFENRIFNGNTTGIYPHNYYFDSITNKTSVPGGIRYDFTGWKAAQHTPRFTYNPSAHYPYDTSSNTGYFVVTSTLLIDSSIMPEEKNHPYMQYYFPGDTSYCITSDKYFFVQSFLTNYVFGYCFECAQLNMTYKTGIGLLNYHWDILAGSPPEEFDTTMLYYVKSGTPCGVYTYPSPINYIEKISELPQPTSSIFPNPANNSLTIKTTATLCTITLQNILGQTIINQQTTKQQETINTANIPAGVYTLTITDVPGNRYNEKVVILH